MNILQWLKAGATLVLDDPAKNQERQSEREALRIAQEHQRLELLQLEAKIQQGQQ